MTALFLYFASLQFNDPDPFWWVAIYGVAAGLCGLAASKHPAPPTFSGVVGATALAWGIFLGSKVYGAGSVTPMYAAQKMTGYLFIDTEEGREMGGLIIVAATLALLIAAQLAMRGSGVRKSDLKHRARH